MTPTGIRCQLTPHLLLNKRGYMTLAIAYFDATHNHPKPESTQPVVHTLAAYVATSESWKKFRKEWRKELDKNGLEYFHMTDFEFARSRAVAGKEIPTRSKFCGWPEDKFVPFRLCCSNRREL